MLITYFILLLDWKLYLRNATSLPGFGLQTALEILRSRSGNSGCRWAHWRRFALNTLPVRMHPAVWQTQRLTGCAGSVPEVDGTGGRISEKTTRNFTWWTGSSWFRISSDQAASFFLQDRYSRYSVPMKYQLLTSKTFLTVLYIPQSVNWMPSWRQPEPSLTWRLLTAAIISEQDILIPHDDRLGGVSSLRLPLMDGQHHGCVPNVIGQQPLKGLPVLADSFTRMVCSHF